MGKECIHSFRKSDAEEVRFSAGQYRDKHYLDIRIFFRPDKDAKQEMVPSKKGVTLPIDMLAEVEKGVSLARKYERSLKAS